MKTFLRASVKYPYKYIRQSSFHSIQLKLTTKYPTRPKSAAFSREFTLYGYYKQENLESLLTQLKAKKPKFQHKKLVVFVI